MIGLGVAHLFENIIPVTTYRPHCLSVVAGGTVVCPVSVAPMGLSILFVLFSSYSGLCLGASAVNKWLNSV